MMAEMPSRADIEAAVEWHREAADRGPHTVAPEEVAMATVAEAWLAAIDGPTVTVRVVTADEGTSHGVYDFDSAPALVDPGTYVLVKKEDR